MRATRDTFLSLSGDVAQHFAADTFAARLAIGHHAARGRDDRHAEAVHDRWNRVPCLVDAQARARDALETLDHRAAGVIAQADAQLGLALVGRHLETLDIAFVLQDVGN